MVINCAGTVENKSEKIHIIVDAARKSFGVRVLEKVYRSCWEMLWSPLKHLKSRVIVWDMVDSYSFILLSGAWVNSVVVGGNATCQMPLKTEEEYNSNYCISKRCRSSVSVVSTDAGDSPGCRPRCSRASKRRSWIERWPWRIPRWL